ncbi:MAG: lipoate--protein ligase family protein [Candidatus Thermoplasmatota archaeon]|nr:lipoate--protein ligase family protein [Candidatus Thermoplasmatota archaeon]
MKEQWRLLNTGHNNAFVNMALDNAILSANREGKVPPTVRFYGWTPSAISIGYFQSLNEEVDIEQCKNFGVDYVRRITGGGAVFHEKEVTYSIVVPESHPSMPKNILKSYSRICGAIIKGLDKLDIKSKYVPINDIIANGKKISGNAQTRKENTVLQHGTIITDVDVEKMFSLLKVSNEKIKDKLIEDVKQRVTSIKHVIGKEPLFDDVANALKVGFEEEFDVDLVKGEITEFEKKLAKSYEYARFSKEEWNFRR